MDKKTVWLYVFRMVLQLLAVVSAAMLLVFIGFCLITGETGFSFMRSKCYGFEAISSCFLLFGMVFWPALTAAAVILVGALIYFPVTRSKHNKEERKSYRRYILRKCRIPFAIIAGCVAVFLILMAVFG